MTRSARLGSAALLFALGAAPDADAAARVFVSVNGNDLNTCSNIATPCRTLDAGVTQVDAAGEVIVLTTGSYAGATITKSVRVNVPTGVVAFSASTITVNPGAGVVVLRGLTIKALVPGTGTGIDHQSGVLFVENSVVDGWADGLFSANAAGALFVKGSIFRNQLACGVRVQSGSTASVAIDDTFFEGNGFAGALFDGGTGRVSDSMMSGNDVGAGAQNAGTQVTFERCEVSSNNWGLAANSSAVLRLSQTTVTRNVTYGLINQASSGTLESFGNNVVRGNGLDVSGTLTTVALQ